MARIARVVIAGCAHHVTQRGNNNEDVFFVEPDRRAYLSILKEQAERFELSVLGYCLMPNHLHLIVVPRGEESLAKAVGGTNLRYARHVNRVHGRSGHLWQNRFFSCALGPGHVLAAVRHVERAPLRARLVRRAWRYPWSSADAHCGGRDESELLDLRAWQKILAGADWRAALAQPEDEAFVKRLRLKTSSGWPLGSDRFVRRLERVLGRPLRPRPVGRPRKKPDEPKTRPARRK
jgi:putative transposase